MKVLTFVSLLLMVIACNQASDVVVLGKNQRIRLIRTDYYGNPANPSQGRSTSYAYDNNNRLQEVASYSTTNTTGAADTKIVFKWLNATALRVEQHFTNPPWSSAILSGLPLKMYSYSETIYNSDSTIRERKFFNITQDGKTDQGSVAKYEYDSQKRIIRRNVSRTDNPLVAYTLYEYDSRGNVVKESYYPGSTLNYVNTYEYDKAPNPYRSIRTDAEIGWFMSTNNIVRQKTVNYASATNSDEQWKYEYRPDGYPARIIYTDGRREEFVYNVP